MTSPNGVLLFREASKAITTYGEHLLAITDIPQDKIYPLKYPTTTQSYMTIGPYNCTLIYIALRFHYIFVYFSLTLIYVERHICLLQDVEGCLVWQLCQLWSV